MRFTLPVVLGVYSLVMFLMGYPDHAVLTASLSTVSGLALYLTRANDMGRLKEALEAVSALGTSNSNKIDMLVEKMQLHKTTSNHTIDRIVGLEAENKKLTAQLVLLQDRLLKLESEVGTNPFGG